MIRNSKFRVNLRPNYMHNSRYWNCDVFFSYQVIKILESYDGQIKARKQGKKFIAYNMKVLEMY